MKVGEAVQKMLELDQNAEFVVNIDYQEGGKIVTGFWMASALITIDYERKKRVEKIGLSELTDELRAEGYSDADVIKNGTKVAVLHCFTSDWVEEEA